MKTRSGFLAVALNASLFASVAPGAVHAETDWPSRVVRVIIPWAAGGGTDPLARVIFGDMSQRLGHTFVPDFKGGASGTIGTAAAARAAPDGYTMMMTSGAPVVNANFMPNVPYDPKVDIVPVAQVTTSPTFVAANVHTPYNTFQELVDYAKAHPDKVNAAFNGFGSTSHRALSTIQHVTGVKFHVVPYAGTGAQQADLMSGVVDIGCGFSTSFMPGIKGGKLKFIAALAPERDPMVPDVQASDESAYKGAYDINWFTVFVPKGTPREIIDKMNAELRTTVTNPVIAKKINELGYAVKIGSPEDAANMIKADVEQMRKLIKAGVFEIPK
ncbi:tripartite tricarboxylate transporter substrate binding protein [Pigmentiphaga soli]|uniref:Tripartite tricarboxylate transporter substrate binding protein n=1 Tax=Pigmentiphaga soli TaxID=1007095 RepID=A0ABP8HHK1_9BURK